MKSKKSMKEYRLRVEAEKNQRKKNNRRYYLHKMLKKTEKTLRLDSHAKIIYVPWDQIPENKYLKQLITLGYSLQTIIV